MVSKGRVYASGSIGCDKELKLVEGGIQAQTVGGSLNMSKFGLMCLFKRAALENLAIVLKASGSGLEHIVKVNVYLANMPRDMQAMNATYIQVS